MANRWFNQWLWSLEKNPAQLWAYVTFGASGAVTLSGINSKGIRSIVKESDAGKYTVTFGVSGGNPVTDTYNALYFASRRFVKATAPSAPHMYVVSEDVQNGTMVIQFTAADGSTATNPASGEVALLQFRVKTSTAK